MSNSVLKAGGAAFADVGIIPSSPVCTPTVAFDTSGSSLRSAGFFKRNDACVTHGRRVHSEGTPSMEPTRDIEFIPPVPPASAMPQCRLALAHDCAKLDDSQESPIVNDLSPDKPGFNSFLHSVADAGLDWLLRRVGADGRGMGGNPTDMCRELLSTRGEASGTALARRLLDTYEAMDRNARRGFFRVLRDRYHVDPDTVLDSAREFARERNDAAFERLARAVEPPRQELFRRLNMAPDGTGALVRMRRDLLHELPEHPSRANHCLRIL